MSTKYATCPTCQKFGGQALSLGRAVLAYTVDIKRVIPCTVFSLGKDGFYTERGEMYLYTEFLLLPTTTIDPDTGDLSIDLAPGQWCFPPRV